MELVAVLIIFILFVFQLSLAILGLITRSNIEKKYNLPLGEMVDAATALENYVKIYRKINLKVNAQIDKPAYALEEFILVNKTKMYNFDLFTNFFTIFQLELSRKEHNFSRKLFVFQNLLFFLQIFFLILGFALQTEWNYIAFYIALGAQVLVMSITFLGYFLIDNVLSNSLGVAYDLLNLDDVELARAENLKNDLKYEVFEYPLEFILRVFRFFLPI